MKRLCTAVWPSAAAINEFTLRGWRVTEQPLIELALGSKHHDRVLAEMLLGTPRARL